MSSLASLIERIDWQRIGAKKKFGTLQLGENDITVQFCKKKGPHDDVITSANEVKIRIGNEVAREWDVITGQKICIFFDPEDVFTMMMAKVAPETGGFKLAKDINGHGYRLKFKWQGIIPIEPMDAVKVQYEIDKGRLIFRVVPPRKLSHSFDRAY